MKSFVATLLIASVFADELEEALNAAQAKA